MISTEYVLTSYSGSCNRLYLIKKKDLQCFERHFNIKHLNCRKVENLKKSRNLFHIIPKRKWQKNTIEQEN